MSAYRRGAEIPMHFLAYIDPGSGSLLIQALIASIVAVPFLLRHHIGRIVESVRGRRSASAASTRPSKDA
jgi:hypothetical protein